MPNPMFAIASSGALSTLASVIGANKAAKGQRDATAAQVKMGDKNIAFQREVFNQQREDAMPWREAGLAALQKIKTGMQDGSFSMDGWNFEADPGYQFRQAEGEKALERGAAARGMLLSGQQLKNTLAYNQNFASNEYNSAYNRERDRRVGEFNRLAGVSGVGQQSTNAINSNASTMAGRVGQTYGNMGQAMATGAANQGQIYQDMYGNIAGSGNQFAENYLTYKMVG